MYDQVIPVSADTMRRLDAKAAETGIASLDLMENAGSGVAEKAAAVLKSLKGNRVAVFCGKGNNGCDGLVAGRKLKNAGLSVEVYLFCKQDDLKGEAAVNLRKYLSLGAQVKEIISRKDVETLREDLNFSLIIDALLGTGFSGSVRGALKDLIKLLNSSGIPIISVDVPSGLNATTGEVNPVAIKAKWTVSFALPKKGFYKERGDDHTGETEVINIGFPEELLIDAIKYEKSEHA